MNADTKKHIDAARQVLVGVVPNPSTQIDQITNALIYKFMDDMDQSVIKIGGKPTFFTGDLEKYAWTRLMDTRLGSQAKMNLYDEALKKFSEAKQLPLLFRDIFKLAVLPYRSPEVLDLFLKEINYFDYSHSEELGNAFEYLLSVMGSQGDAGMFRTPRHIIEFIVDVVNPTKDDKILDPACGTAGFLISAYKHILDQHDGKDDPKKIEKPLTPEQKKKLTNNFIGYDISPEMVRLSRVNMYLHQFKEPQIIAYNTLADEERWSDKFDVILANPPFMTPKGAGKPHSKFTIQATKSEVLFVDYIMNHLRPKGRAGIIVPEGIIFQSGKSHKELRKNLVNDGLYAVVSLPSGVFAPYAGVKTSVLLFDNELAKQKTEMLFVKVENDGFDLGATKRPISKNDLPTALDILNKWNTGEKIENKLAVYVEKTKIAENGDYNLSGDRYRIATDYTNAKWQMVKLKEVAAVDWGNTNITKKEYIDNGGHLAVSAAGCDGRMDKFEHEVGVTVLSAIGANCGGVFYPTEKFIAIKNTMTFTPDRTKLNPKFLYLIMKENSLPRRGGGQPFMAKADVEEYIIPLPPLEIQDQIVAELDSYAGIIAGAKQIAQNWKPKINIDPEWEKVKLGEVVEIFNGSTPKRTETSYWENGTIPWFTIDDIRTQGRFITKTEQKITEKGFKQSSVKLLPRDTVLLCCTASMGEYAFSEIELTTNQQFNGLVVKEKNRLNPKYLFWYSSLFKEELERMSGKATFGFVAVGTLKNFEIPLPPLGIQKQIVERIESERTLVESSKKLIAIYTKKTKEVIAKLWTE